MRAPENELMMFVLMVSLGQRCGVVDNGVVRKLVCDFKLSFPIALILRYYFSLFSLSPPPSFLIVSL